MNHNPTGPNPVTPIYTDPRDGLMRALAVAETVAANLPDRPTDIAINHATGDAYRIGIYFHRKPEYVFRFADHYDIQSTATPNGDDVSKTYTSAETRIDGVIVRAWSLTDTETPITHQTTAEHQTEDPHDSPLHHDYALGHDLPAPTTLPETLR